MQALIRHPSITVFPILLAGHPDARVAEVVGVLLERGGLKRVEIGPAGFAPEPAEDFQHQSEAFGRFVAKAGLKSDYALLGEFLGSPGSSVAEVRGALVDHRGTIVWQGRQHPGDASFERIAPTCPMDCSMLLVECLRTPLELRAEPAAGAPAGPLEKRLRAESGLPGEEELAAMKARLASLRARSAGATLLVYPVRAGEQWSSASAQRLAKLIGERTPLKASAAAEPLRFEARASRNEQVTLWSGARSIRTLVRAAHPAADYVLAADFIISQRTGKALAVHTFLLDAAGEWVIVDFQNSHHSDFKSIAPASREDCCDLAALRIAGYLD